MAQKQIGALTVASSLNDSDLVVISQGGITKSATVALARVASIAKTDELGFDYPITSPANGTIVVVFNNRNIGTVLGTDMRMVVGSCTATWRIADRGGTSPTTITGLGSLSVTSATTPLESDATALNVMLKSGSADRELQLVLASVSGAGPLLTAVRYTRA